MNQLRSIILFIFLFYFIIPILFFLKHTQKNKLFLCLLMNEISSNSEWYFEALLREN